MTTRTMVKRTATAVALAIAIAGTAHAAGKAGGKQAYLVVSPHTAETCLAALDHMAAARTLPKFEFGCKGGDHTGYARVEAASPDEALAIVPAEERGAARAVQLDRFTAEQVKALHGGGK